MKTVKCLILTALVAVIMITSTSCSKSVIGIDAAFQIGPVFVHLSFGGGNLTGPYYPMYGFPPTVTSSVAYILSAPINQNSIAVFDQTGRSMGIVDCSTGDWRQANNMYAFLQHWDYSKGPCVVLVSWTHFGSQMSGSIA